MTAPSPVLLSSSPPLADHVSVSVRGVRVLVVEPSEAEFEHIRLLLQVGATRPYQTEWISHRQTAVEAINGGIFDVVLLGYHSDEGTSLEVLVHSLAEVSGVPVILLTSEDAPEIDQAAAAAGAADCLSKDSLNTPKLERSIRYALKHSSVTAALRRSQSQLRLFMDNIPCAVCVHDNNGAFLFQNEVFRNYFDAESLQRLYSQTAGGASRYYFDGRRHWLVTPFPLVDERGQELRGVAAIDITERVLAERAFQRTSQLLNGVLSTLPIVIGRIDEQGIVQELRGSGLTALGARDHQLIGTDAFQAPPEVVKQLKEAMRGEHVNGVMRVEHDGHVRFFDSYFSHDASRGGGVIGFSIDVTQRMEAEALGKRKSQLLNGIFANLPVVAGRLDAQGRVTEIEGDGMSRCGMTSPALLGKRLARVYPQLKDASSEALAGGATSNVLVSGRTEGAEWHAEFYLFFDRETAQGAIFFGRDITERKVLEKTLLGISDAEQHRIGGDLHDGLGQYLTGISCLTTALRDKLKGQGRPESDEADTIAGLVQEAITQTRALARGLCPVQLENSGLESALEDLAYQIQRLHGLKCNFETAGPTHICDPVNSVHLYRIAQEAINNAVKHGAPRSITVKLDFSNPEKTLTIVDDGEGFDITAKARPSVGLQLMSYRAGMIGGTLKVDSRPKAGTRVQCIFSNSTLNHENSK